MTSTILKARVKEDGIVLADALLIDAKLSIRLSESGTFEFSIPNNTYAAQNMKEGAYCEIFDGSDILMSGYIVETDQKDRNGKTVLIVKGRDLTDEIYRERALPTAYYEDVPLAAILAQMLYYLGWRLGEVGTAVDFLETQIGIDLRNETNLMAQIQKLFEKEAGLTFRYGGIENGFPTIDIGTFGENGHIRLYTTPFASAVKNFTPNTGAITEFETSQSNDELIYELEPYGGEIDDAGVSRPCGMEDHLRHGGTDTLSQDPDFPMIETVSGSVVSIYNPTLKGEGGLIQILADATDNIIVGDVADVERVYAHRFYCYPGWLTELGIKLGSTFTITPPNNLWLRIWSDTSGPLPDQVLFEYNLGDVTTLVPSNMNFWRWAKEESIYLDGGTPYWWSLQWENAQATSEHIILVSQTNPDQGIQQGGTVLYNHATLTRYPNIPVWNTYESNRTIRCHIKTEGDSEPVGVAKNITWNEYTPAYTKGPYALGALIPVVRSMYERAVAYMKERQYVWNNYKIKAIGNALFPEVGDKVYISYVDKQQIRDEFRRNYQQVTTQLQTWLTCLAVDVNYKNGKVEWSFDLTDGFASKPSNVVTSIYDTRVTEQRVGAGVPFPISPTIETVVETIPLATAADETMSDGRPAKRVEFTTLPAVLSNSGHMIPAGIPYVTTSTSSMDVEVIEWGDLNKGVLTSPVCRIAPINGWNFSHSATVETKLIFLP